MLPQTKTLNKYHDKKRRIEYIRITRLLNQQNKITNEGEEEEEVNEVIMGESLREHKPQRALNNYQKIQILRDPALNKVLEPLEQSLEREQQKKHQQ